MRNQRAVAINTTTSGIVSPAVLYRLHVDNAGTNEELTDALGNGGNLTSNGTGTPFSSSVAYNPNGTDNYLTLASDSYIPALCAMDTLYSSGAQIIIAGTLVPTTDSSGNNTPIWWGSNANSGALGVNLNSAEQFVMLTRGEGSGGSVSSATLSGWTYTGRTTPIHFVLAIRATAATTGHVDLYVDGVSETSSSGWDLVGGAATGPLSNAQTGPFNIGARDNNGTPDRYMNSAGVAGTLDEVLIARRATVDSALVADFADEFHALSGDCLLAAQRVGL